MISILLASLFGKCAQLSIPRKFSTDMYKIARSNVYSKVDNFIKNCHLSKLILLLLIIYGIEPNPGPSFPSNLHNMKIVHNNVCSLPPKVDLIECELSEYDIIAITESHLDNTVPDSSLKLAGFQKPVRLDRTRAGGGIAVYVKNNLYFEEQPDLLNQEIELLWLKVSYQHNHFLLGVFYRPPNSRVKLWDYFYDSVSKALDKNLPVILTGDFNIDMLSNAAIGHNHLENLMQRLSMVNLVWEATNFTTTPGTCIDLFLTNNRNTVKSVEVLSPFCSSHAPVSAEINFKVHKEYSFKRTIRKYDSANYVGFVRDLNEIDWNDTFNTCDNINDMYSKFLDIYSSHVDKHIPTKTITVRPADKPFMNNTIRRKIRQRNRIHYKAKNSNSAAHWQKFRELRNEVIDLVRKSKENYRQKLTSELTDKTIPPGKWWRIVKSISKLSKSREPVPYLKSEGQIFVHPVDKAEVLNKHFSNISKIDIEPELPNNVPDPPVIMENFDILETEVFDQLSNLNPNKPPGPDGISPKVLYEIKDGICKPLTLLYNYSLLYKKVPHAWKVSHVTPVFKGKGSSHEPVNYRPISLTSVVCKIMEKILFKHLYNFMKDNNLLTKYQSGFQPGDGTINQLIDIYNTIISCLDQGKDVRFIFCDISKAFDKVWHSGLLFKLRFYGIHQSLIDWIADYLGDRSQKVVLDGFSSTNTGITAGVPQGSVLGPFLFLLYINDIVDNIYNHIRLFADDTSLFAVIDNNLDTVSQSLTDDLGKIDSWAKNWAVTFNPSKTETLTFTRRNVIHPYIFFGTDGEEIKEVDQHCHLGLNFQSNATWKEHINIIYNKACSRLHLLRQVKYLLDRNSLITIYLAFIRPVLEYADTIWDNCTLGESNLLESVQIEASRIITGLRRTTSLRKLYCELGFEKLSDRRKKHKLITFYKIVNGLCPPYMFDLLSPCIPREHGYNLRQGQNFILPQCKTVSYYKSFIPSTIKLWNELESSTKNALSVNSFKSNIDKIYKPDKPPKYYNFGLRKLNIIHCQLRNEASNLNSHLFHDFLTEDPSCPKCLYACEDNQHFFFDCPAYDNIRDILFRNLLHYHVNLDLNLFLFGDISLSFEENIEIVKEVQEYIKNSKRFE